MTITFSDGKQKIIVKNVYAYHYNAKGGGCLGKTHMEGSACAFIKKIQKMGFEVVKK